MSNLNIPVESSPTGRGKPEGSGSPITVDPEKKLEVEASPRPELSASVTSQEIFFGPLPHPDHIAQYEKICPGIAEKIFASKDLEQKHRHEIELAQVTAIIADSKQNRKERGRGQVFAFIIAIVGILSGAVVIGLDHPVSGTLLSGGSLTTLVGLFIAGQRADERSRSVSAQQNEQGEPEAIESKNRPENLQASAKELSVRTTAE